MALEIRDPDHVFERAGTKESRQTTAGKKKGEGTAAKYWIWDYLRWEFSGQYFLGQENSANN